MKYTPFVLMLVMVDLGCKPKSASNIKGDDVPLANPAGMPVGAEQPAFPLTFRAAVDTESPVLQTFTDTRCFAPLMGCVQFWLKLHTTGICMSDAAPSLISVVSGNESFSDQENIAYVTFVCSQVEGIDYRPGENPNDVANVATQMRQPIVFRHSHQQAAMPNFGP